MEGALRALEARWRAVSRVVPGVLYQLSRRADGSEYLRWVSGDVEMLFGVTAEEARAESSALHRHIEPASLARLAKEGEAYWSNPREWRTGFRVLHPERGVRELELRAIPELFLDEGLGWTGHVRDVTEVRHSEAQRLEESRRDAVARMAGGVAHEFNNHLAALLGTAELLVGADPYDPDTRGLARALVRDIEDARTIARQLLAFTREQPMQVEALDAVSFVREVIIFALRGSAVRGAWTVTGDVPPILADRNLLQQVLVNVILNARQAMGEQGVVQVTLQAESWNGPGERVMVSVEDDGPGIALEDRERIFEPYWSTRPEGSGLGLHVVHTLLDRLGGEIHVRPPLQLRGARFELLLPAAQGTSSVHSRSADWDTLHGMGTGPGGTLVHVLDDDPRQRRVLERLLGRAGFSVRTHATGEEMMDVLPLLGSDEPTIVFLMDVVVASGSGGLELATGLRDRFPNARIVLMSGYANRWPEWREHLRAAQVSFLPKPFRFKELMRILGYSG